MPPSRRSGRRKKIAWAAGRASLGSDHRYRYLAVRSTPAKLDAKSPLISPHLIHQTWPSSSGVDQAVKGEGELSEDRSSAFHPPRR
eukprot:scaffold61347_cov60-Phaeocystis_antarctica.AAC.1